MKTKKLIILGLSSLLLTVTASAGDKEKGKGKGPKGPKRPFEQVDTDKDGKVSLAEFTTGAKNAEKAAAHFAKKDADGDNFLSQAEYDAKPKGKKKKKKADE